MSESKKQYRAKMRAQHGADWWKKAKKPKAKAKKAAKKPTTTRQGGAASYEKKWAGFPIRVGGMEGSSLLDPQYGDSFYKGDLVYDDSDQVGEFSWGVTVEKKGSKYNILGGASAPYAGGGSEAILLSGASRAEAIRYLKGLKDYYGPDED